MKMTEGKHVQGLIEYDLGHTKSSGTSLSEKLLLYSVIRNSGIKSAIEIGVNRGHMTCWMALALKHNGGRLTSVDNWSLTYGGDVESSAHASTRLGENGLVDIVEFVDSDGSEYLCARKDASYEMVWVDGDHSFDGARRDILEAVRVATKIVGVHDIAQGYSGPRDACVDIEHMCGLSGLWLDNGRGVWLVNVGGR